ncbi:MAG: hypothetical protein M3376_01725 [Actinomycetota bacterium]|nr:hypothetical protein [Actinomycetota bacterium]
MRPWRLIAWFPVVWTLAMGVWLALYRQTPATCGPEIERDCSIGLSVTIGLGRPGIILLWSLGMAAYTVALLTDRRRRSRGEQRPPKARKRRLAAAGMLAVVLAASIAVALPASTRQTPEPPTAATGVDVQVISAILHPSASSAGRNRHAARVSVHVRLTNRGRRRVSTEPMLLSGGVKLPYDRRQFTLGPLRPGVVRDATLRFEPRSPFTQRLVTERDARLQIAGRMIALTLKIGSPVRKSPLRGALRRAEARRATRRRPSAAARTRAPAPAPRRAPAPPASRPRIPAPPPPAPPGATPPPPPPRRSERNDDKPPTSFDDSG